METININIERELNIRLGTKTYKGRVFIGKLFYQEEKNRWACEWDLSYLHHEVGRIYGEDPFAALMNTLEFLATFIRGSEEDGYGIWWKEEGDHGGIDFPIFLKEVWKKKTSEQNPPEAG